MLKHSINQNNWISRSKYKYDKKHLIHIKTLKCWVKEPFCFLKINVYLNVRWNTLEQPRLWRQLTILSSESFLAPLISHDLQSSIWTHLLAVLTFPLCLVMRLLQRNKIKQFTLKLSFSTCKYPEHTLFGKLRKRLRKRWLWLQIKGSYIILLKKVFCVQCV